MLSLRRTLAVRFSVTMLVALLAIAAWAVLAGHALLERDLRAAGIDPATVSAAAASVTRDVLWLMGTTIVLATVATAFGAGWLARRATGPVGEIAAQARTVTPGRGAKRITAHAEVEEFAQLVEVLNGTLDRLDRGIESQRRLIADAGHDLRTPLTAMRGELEVGLRGSRSPEAYRAVLASVLDEVEHLVALSDSLLALARLDADELRPNPSAFPAGPFLAAAAERWRERIEGRTVRVDLADGSPTIQADADLLALALDHLLDNVRRHTPPGTTVTLSARREADRVTLVVSDDGPGQPPGNLPFLFDRFFRSDASRTRSGHPGAGLGLTLVQAVAAAHGGSAGAAAAPSGGLQVTLSLPAA